MMATRRSFVLAALALTTAPALGDVVAASYNGASEFHYGISDMPDLDMIRINGFVGNTFVNGLPFGGTGHDLPACMMNLFAYAANHGFPELEPGPGEWQSGSRYDDATDAIELFGDVAFTDAEGTPFQQGAIAVQAWLNAFCGKLVVETKTGSAYQVPTLATAASKAVGGAIVAICYGKYPKLSETGDEPIIVGVRDGGLWIVPTRLDRGPGPLPGIKFRSPFTVSGEGYGESGMLQSPFSWTAYINPVEAPVLRLGQFQPVSMTVLAPPAITNPKIYLMDAMVALRPRATYSWSNTTPNPILSVHSVATLDPMFAPDEEHSLSLPPGSTLQQGAKLFGNCLAGITMSAAGVGKLECIDLDSLSTAVIDTVSPGARLATSPSEVVYVLGGGILRAYDFHANPPLIGERVLSTYADVAFDDANGRVVLYSPALRLLTRLKPDLTDDSFFLLPTSVPTASTGEVTVGPNGTMWVRPGTANALYEAKPVRGSTTPTVEAMSFPSMLGFTDFEVDDNNRIFLAVNGTLKEFWFDPVDDRWEPAIDSPSGLNGTPCSGRIVLAKKRIDFDASMAGPAWRSLGAGEVLDGPTTPDCLGDLQVDGVVNGADLSIVLSSWGAAQGNPADLTSDGVVDGADLAALLASWGPCPPATP
ncbi:MAG: hypothetical protein JNM94_14370 [Phycisphaerae bacterium]|nr:hypothetical protein [Phycisphaerae bacterium]